MTPHGLAVRLRDLPETVGLPWGYFERRGIWLDCRGPLVIHPKTYWGYSVQVYTESHDISHWPKLGPVKPYGVTVDQGAWIGSGSILTGCHIGQSAIVAAGSVVRGQDVEPFCMVAGNPARIVARWREGRWQYFNGAESGYHRRLS
jgi:hypothetical protein